MASEWIGRTLSKVEIRQHLSRGGMAELYLGQHTTLERPVAVKVLHAHLSEDDTLLARFKDEARAVAALRHPNIVQVYDFDMAEGRPYIVMELLEGISLAEYLRVQRKVGRTLPPATTARIIKGVAGALDYAHQRGIVHRDIKPSNVMLRRESGSVDPDAPLPADVQPVLTDFGVARLSNVTTRTASGAIIGTPAYMSPEQVRGENVDARSDIYSLGIVLYEMLAGRAPFDPDTETAASILVKHMNEAPPPLPKASPEVQAVADRALAKDRETRFQSAGELSRAFNNALGLEGLDSQLTAPMDAFVTHPEGPGEARRRLNPLWIVGGVLALGGLLVVGLVAGGLILASVFGGGATATQEEAAAVGQGAGSEVAQEPPTAEGEAQVGAGGADTSTPVGLALFRDDTLVVELSNLVPPPDGFTYEAWLIADGGGEDVSLGTAQVVDGRLSLTFTDPAGGSLVEQYAGFALTLEPADDGDPASSGQMAYRGQLGQESLARARHMLAEARGQAFAAALSGGLPAQADTYNSHLGFAVDAANSGDLSGAKLHSEHVVNIVEGSLSADFGDWNGDGQAQNPGDAVGLLPYLLILADSARAAAALPDASPAVVASSEQITAAVDELAVRVADARELAKRVTAADTVEEAQPLIDEMDGIRIQDAVAQLLQAAEPLDLGVGAEVFAVAP